MNWFKRFWEYKEPSCEKIPKKDDLRIVKKTKGNGKSGYFLEYFGEGQWQNFPFSVKDGHITPGYYHMGGSYSDFTSRCDEGLDSPDLLCKYIKNREEQKRQQEITKYLNSVVKTEVVECCSTLPRKIN